MIIKNYRVSTHLLVLFIAHY